jgi:hypothetical protein
MTRSFFKNVRQNFMLAPAEDKRLFLQALIWSIKVRFCMVFLPFRYYRELLGKMQTEAVNTVTDMQPTLQIKTIVSAVCRHTPWESKCLVEAVVCKKLLQKRGIETTLYLGILMDGNKGLKAHAWLKLGDTILTGVRGHKKYRVVNFYG